MALRQHNLLQAAAQRRCWRSSPKAAAEGQVLQVHSTVYKALQSRATSIRGSRAADATGTLPSTVCTPSAAHLLVQA